MMGDLETPKVGLYFMSTGKAPTCLVQTQKTFSDVKTIQFKTDVSIDDVLFDVKSGKKCVAVFTVFERNDLSVIVNALFGLKKELRERKLIAIAFVKFSSDKVDDLLMKSGCSELLKFDLNAKAFTYKINRYLKILEQEESGDDLVSLLSDKGGDSQGGRQKLEGSRDSGPSAFNVHLTQAWTGGDDFWLFRKKAYAKKYQNFWLIELIGPSPAAGSWEKVEDQLWRWQARATHPFFDVSPTVWQFRGKQPQYSWVINRWGFVSENPSLALMTDGSVLHSRFKLRDPLNIEIANNSEYARSIFQKIKDTYDRDYYLQAEHIESKNLEGKLGHDPEIPWTDKTDSKTLQASDWNIQENQSEKAREIGEGNFTDFLKGSEALLSCGLTGMVKNYPVDILEYNEEHSTLSIGLNAALVEYKELIEVGITSEHLDLPPHLILRGVVTHIDAGDDSGNSNAVVLMLQNSKKEFNQILNAVHRRQQEVISFFKISRGLE
jgi:hypothetical protein